MLIPRIRLKGPDAYGREENTGDIIDGYFGDRLAVRRNSKHDIKHSISVSI